MNQIVECVPNFSEGRHSETIKQLVEAVESVDEAFVLGSHVDTDHNRSVITFVASPENVVDAALQAVATAADLIDLRQHTGVHPRIGATDVLPFVPVRGVTMDQCVALAHEAGERIARELQIPVYFYERAALRKARARLENVRQRGFEELREQIGIDPLRAPDVGPPRVHKTAGSIAIGARPFLIAFNVNLRTNDISIARAIARAVRARDGGLPYVKALGFELKSRGLVQISMNLIDYESTGLVAVFTAVRSLTESFGVEIAGTEIVGLVPEVALNRSALYFSLLENFTEDLVLENCLRARLKAG
ncbi:MAG TPA: glutamate formimidoyltransferase [Pyrinomonadaceae bacterium]|nr:glutamate formimidoyltransferase [Pyrinomonadaceae bacterium]